MILKDQGKLEEAISSYKKAITLFPENDHVYTNIGVAYQEQGNLNSALEVLKDELKSDHQWGRLAATIVIDEMDEDARPLINDLKKVLKTRQPNKYIIRVANRALNDLLGTNNQVP